MNDYNGKCPAIVRIYNSKPEGYEPPCSDTILDHIARKLEDINPVNERGLSVEESIEELRPIHNVLRVESQAKAYETFCNENFALSRSYIENRQELIDMFSHARTNILEKIYSQNLSEDETVESLHAKNSQAKEFMRWANFNDDDYCDAHIVNLCLLHDANKQKRASESAAPLTPRLLLEELLQLDYFADATLTSKTRLLGRQVAEAVCRYWGFSLDLKIFNKESFEESEVESQPRVIKISVNDKPHVNKGSRKKRNQSNVKDLALQSKRERKMARRAGVLRGRDLFT